MAAKDIPLDLEAAGALCERIARSVRVQEARARGIRAVPAEPGPEFAAVPFACDVRPTRCSDCRMSCPYGDTFARVRFGGDC